MVVTCRWEVPVAITMWSAKLALPIRLMTAMSFALSSFSETWIVSIKTFDALCVALHWRTALFPFILGLFFSRKFGAYPRCRGSIRFCSKKNPSRWAHVGQPWPAGWFNSKPLEPAGSFPGKCSSRVCRARKTRNGDHAKDLSPALPFWYLS